MFEPRVNQLCSNQKGVCKQMEKYEELDVEVIAFTSDDIITDSECFYYGCPLDGVHCQTDWDTPPVCLMGTMDK